MAEIPVYSNFESTPSFPCETVDEKLALIRMRRIANIPLSILEDIRDALLDKGGAHTQALAAESTKGLDLRIRQLIQGDAAWKQISEILWSEYRQVRSPENAARILETSFLQASPLETVKAFEVILSKGASGFYWLLHPRLRDFLLENAGAHLVDALYAMLATERQAQLTDAEVLFMFLRLSDSGDKAAAWSFFKRNQQSILDCISGQDRFAYTREALIFKAGELALDLTLIREAKELLNLLPRTSVERSQALETLLQYESTTLDRSKNSLSYKLQHLDRWQDRIQCLNESFHAIRSNGGLKDPNRAPLNLMMKSAFELVPKTAPAWRAMGELIIQNRDLVGIIPAMLQSLFDQACIYHDEDLDTALWSGAVQLQPETPQDAYISGLGWLHFFVAHSRRSDTALWTAQKMIDFAVTNLPGRMPLVWRDLVRRTVSFLENAEQFHPRDRKRVAATLRVSVDGGNSPSDVIQQYLALSDSPSRELVENLSAEAWSRQNYQAFIDLALKTSSHSLCRTSILRKLWTAAAHLGDYDLGWRAASVMASRDSLDPRVKQSWSISGERRSVYAPLSLAVNDMECVLADVPRKTRRVLHNLVVLGGRVAELAEFTKRQSLSEVNAVQAVCTTEKAILKSLAESKMGLPHGMKTVFELARIADIPVEIAGMIQSPESNPWLFTNKVLFERLGVTSWGYSRQILIDLTTSVLPLIGTASHKQTAKLGKWLTSLTSHQRAAWTELSGGLAEVSDQEFAQDLLQFVMRLATLIYPSHFEALKTLQKSKVSLESLRRLENFILSPKYSEFRRRTGTSSRVVIPKPLMLDEISESGT